MRRIGGLKVALNYSTSFYSYFQFFHFEDLAERLVEGGLAIFFVNKSTEISDSFFP